VEFTVEKLESILLSEAARRGERLYRVMLSRKEETFFVWERLFIDLGRMERSFNVVRVSPDDDEIKEMPDRVVYHVTTEMPFEKAAAAAASILNGSVDIAEIPFSSWQEERCKWQTERPGSRFKALDSRHMEIALLILSYKILRFDMERIVEALGAGSEERADAERALPGFEKRLLKLESSRILFLAFKRSGSSYLIPRFMVSALRWEGGELLDGRDVDPMTGMPDARGRFGVSIKDSGAGSPEFLNADRLLTFKDIALGEIQIRNRLSKVCFEANVQGQAWRLILPERSLEA
jgi:hypothetical protein